MFYGLDSDLESSDDDHDKIKHTDLVIQPPMECADAETDKDSDKSDDELQGDFNHLPRRILATRCEISRQIDNGGSDVDDSSVPSTSSRKRQKPTKSNAKKSKKQKKDERKWNQNESSVGTKIPLFSIMNKPTAMDLCNENMKSPLQSLQNFLTDELIEHILTQSHLYASQKNLKSDHLTKENILVFIGILLVSGYNKLPDRKLYWSIAPDVHNQLISKSMRRDTFEGIMRSLHLANNMQMNDDRFFKVRPFFDMLNEAFKICDLTEHLSVDETVVPYFGHHGLKQFIRGKPIRFGFKLWTLASPEGFMFHAEPYSGSSTKLPQTGLGQGPDVVLGLIEKVQAREGNHIVMDNLFTTIPLLNELSKKGIAGTGTIRENRLEKAPLAPKKDLKKSPRGTYESACTDDVIIVKWNDNTVVSVASNKIKSFPCVSAERWSAAEKKKIQVPMPQPLQTYNKYMGGVDLFDQFVAQYRIRIRSKKWWWPLFSWGISAAVVNGWNLYRLMGNDISLLQFTRECSQELLGKFGTPPTGPGRALVLQKNAFEQQRYDRKDHWLYKSDQQFGRCKNCGRRSVYRCEKCQVPLHPECHKNYHLSV